MEKMTYVSCINDVLNGVALTDEHKEKLNAMIKHFTKASQKPEGPNAKQKENMAMANRIADAMVDGLKYTTTEIIQTFDFLKTEDGVPFNVQKVSPMLHKLEANDRIHSVTIKGKNYFYKGTLAED